MQSVDLGVMILVHRREWPVSLIVEQIKSTWPKATIWFTLDRYTGDIPEVVNNPERGIFTSRAPFPVVDDSGEHFMAIRQWQLERLRNVIGPRYIGFWDDDHLLENPDEAKLWMEKGVDIIDAQKAFFWNDLEHTNERIPPHTSPIFFKDRPGTSFPDTESRIIHTPVEIYDDPNSVRVALTGRLLDVGYLEQTERERVFATYARAGKIDAATMALVDEPVLKKFNSILPAYRRLKENYES